VLITRGGSGIGRATALQVARECAKVMITDYVLEGAFKTVVMVRETGGTADCIAADVSVPGQVEAVVSKTVATFGRLDCAFNNAGILELARPLPTLCLTCDRDIQEIPFHLSLPMKIDSLRSGGRIGFSSVRRQVADP